MVVVADVLHDFDEVEYVALYVAFTGAHEEEAVLFGFWGEEVICEDHFGDCGGFAFVEDYGFDQVDVPAVVFDQVGFGGPEDVGFPFSEFGLRVGVLDVAEFREEVDGCVAPNFGGGKDGVEGLEVEEFEYHDEGLDLAEIGDFGVTVIADELFFGVVFVVDPVHGVGQGCVDGCFFVGLIDEMGGNFYIVVAAGGTEYQTTGAAVMFAIEEGEILET